MHHSNLSISWFLDKNLLIFLYHGLMRILWMWITRCWIVTPKHFNLWKDATPLLLIFWNLLISWTDLVLLQEIEICIPWYHFLQTIIAMFRQLIKQSPDDDEGWQSKPVLQVWYSWFPFLWFVNSWWFLKGNFCNDLLLCYAFYDWGNGVNRRI